MEMTARNSDFRHQISVKISNKLYEISGSVGPLVLRVSKYPPNVIFLLLPCMQKKSGKCYSIEESEGELYSI